MPAMPERATDGAAAEPAARAAAQAALERGLALEAAQQPAQAYALFEQATELDPGNGRAWRQRGNLLRRAGELGAASTCFERAIEAGDDRALNTFFLSAIGVGPVVMAPPASFVSALFDQYAPRFDAHLRDTLHYRAPELLVQWVARDGAASSGHPLFDSVLDLGCGTGLMGQAIRPLARRLTGLDLSTQMLERAARTGAYARLVAGGLVEHLQTTDERFDLVLACDVFNYLGELRPVFAGARRVLTPGGGFAFTAEACEAEAGVDLLPSLRYAHSERHLRALAAEHGFKVRAMEKAALREQDGEPIDGLIFHLGLPA
ncbi:MAG TPA: methyltransferase domain-containing protein [Burkholderiaceae bacterium]|jgi:predicted TPR repeat methyltransferase